MKTSLLSLLLAVSLFNDGNINNYKCIIILDLYT